MSFISPEILYLTSGISRCAFLVVFLTTVFSQPDERCLRHWLTALTASAAGSLSMSLSPSYPIAPFPLSLITTTLFFSSLSLSWSGLRIFYQRSIDIRILVLITITPGILLMVLLWLDASQILQLAMTFFVTAVMTALAMVEILRPPRKRILSQYVVAMAFFIYFIALFVPFVMLVTGVMTMEMMVSGQAAIMADQVLCILIYFGFIAMTSERSSITLKRLSETDQLTGLANRRAVQGVLKKRAVHRHTEEASSVIIIDLDHFKSVNDRWGHDAGDAVLKQFAQHLVAITRKQDMAVRWGGEEFLILLPDTTLEEAAIMAERLRHRVESTPFPLEPQTLKITISLGVAASRADASHFESVLQNADEALYRAKHEGRNRVCRHDVSSIPTPPPTRA
ncbi:GGDEF domain-containing protein [Kushneria phyllosphaerae]|uniref:diguanylate cyclase n=1 Tax=Kushneria phyllosphaerae TaxID=2100822 RepID=A0A2R8CJJ7_9GAMM|nr:GGDEF domain-containing protein [Kushneria phyllosphaerae]SPJ33066.1 Response regulator PleD [Kushneria phyllosphaerae]